MKAWEDCNKPYWLARQFLNTIEQPSFNGRKPTTQFFKLYAFFKKVPVDMLNLFHEYMESTGKDASLTMKGLFFKAPEWNQKQRMTVIKETTTEDYLKLLQEW